MVISLSLPKVGIILLLDFNILRQKSTIVFDQKIKGQKQNNTINSSSKMEPQTKFLSQMLPHCSPRRIPTYYKLEIPNEIK